MKSRGVSIINYGMGNVSSVVNACESLGSVCQVANSPQDLENAERIILPGVGAFGDAMRLLREGGWLPALQKQVQDERKPLLGICLGMQLLATTGHEYGVHQGLGFIDGEVVKIPQPAAQERIPHIGWNEAVIPAAEGLYAGFGPRATFYFVHSYVLQAAQESVVTAWCEHGGRWAASVQKGNIYGAQYHPEKSQRDGLKLLQNFLSLPVNDGADGVVRDHA